MASQKSHQIKNERTGFWIIVGLTFAAFVLRITDLTGRSMWLDEGYTLVRIVGSWQSILVNVMQNQGLPYIDNHPPLYFLLLKAWNILAGPNEFELKLFSALGGIIIMPLTYVLARRLFSRATGVLAAVLALSSPAYQWYSHDLRMYPMVFCLAALSTYCFYRWAQVRLTGQPNSWWIAWLITTIASLTTQYLMISLAVVQGIGFILILLYRRPLFMRRKVLIISFITAAISGLAIICVALQAGIFNLPAITPLTDLTQHVIDGTLYGMNATDPTNWVLCWSFAGICVMGFLLPFKHLFSREFACARLLLIATAFGPIVMIDIGLTVTYRFIDVRYFAMVMPALHVLFARGAGVVWSQMSTGALRTSVQNAAMRLVPWGRKIIAGLAIMAVIAAQVFGLAWGFIRTPFWQDDWRGMAAYIRDNYQSGDALVMGIYTPDEVLKLYLHDVPVDYLYATQFLNMPTDQAGHAIAKSHKRIWYAETGRSVKTRLDTALMPYFRHARLPANSRTDLLDLFLYEVESPVTISFPATATAVKYPVTANAQTPLVAAYELKPGNRYNALPNMRLSIYWQRQGLVDGSQYNVALRLKSADNAS